MAAKAMRANEEFFELMAGDIFARLYTFFPVPIDIASDAILYNDAALEHDELSDSDRLIEIYGHSVRWLANEGYLRFSEEIPGEDDNETTFVSAVLTAKGLGALRKMPDALVGPGQTIGDKMKEVAVDVSSDAAKGTMKQLVGAALGWIAKGVAGG